MSLNCYPAGAPSSSGGGSNVPNAPTDDGDYALRVSNNGETRQWTNKPTFSSLGIGVAGETVFLAAVPSSPGPQPGLTITGDGISSAADLFVGRNMTSVGIANAGQYLIHDGGFNTYQVASLDANIEPEKLIFGATGFSTITSWFHVEPHSPGWVVDDGVGHQIALRNDGGDPSALSIDSNVIAPSVLADYFTAYTQVRMRDADSGDIVNIASFDTPGAPTAMVMGDLAETYGTSILGNGILLKSGAGLGFPIAPTAGGLALDIPNTSATYIGSTWDLFTIGAIGIHAGMGGAQYLLDPTTGHTLFGPAFLAALDSHYIESGNTGFYRGADNVDVLMGSGSPEGVVTAVNGSIYLSRDGGTGSAPTIFQKTGVGANTGWTAIY